jgi:hypothetical protein
MLLTAGFILMGDGLKPVRSDELGYGVASASNGPRHETSIPHCFQGSLG